MEATTTQVGMPLDEFIRLYDTEGPFELINGERKSIVVTVAGHGAVTQAIFLALHLFVSTRQLGDVFMEHTFVLSYVSNWVTGSRQPDVMFYQADRMTAYKSANPDWKLKPYILVPDLVIEVVSPNDNLAELDEKVDLYLTDGVKVVWVVDPQRVKVSVFTPVPDKAHTRQQTTLTADDILRGDETIPGFEMKVGDIFA